MSAVDAAFGGLLASLEQARQRQNTLLMLTSDNGPEHRHRHSWGSTGGLRGAKGYVYEGGIRVPLMVQWPARRLAPLRELPCVTDRDGLVMALRQADEVCAATRRAAREAEAASEAAFDEADAFVKAMMTGCDAFAPIADPAMGKRRPRHRQLAPLTDAASSPVDPT